MRLFFSAYSPMAGAGEVSPLTALKEAKNISRIVGGSRDVFSAYRFLLALASWITPKGAEFDPQQAVDDLESSRSYFDLFGEKKRFFQDRTVVNEVRMTVGYLYEEIPTGTNLNLLGGVRKPFDKEYGLCPHCCIRGLLRIPAYATAGGQGKKCSINGTPPLYAYSVAANLHQTLLLNWRESPSGDLPSWVGEVKGTPTIGCQEAYTWLSRSVYLFPEFSPEPCFLCGVRSSMSVRECCFKPGREPADAVGRWSDPHVLAVLKEGGSRAKPNYRQQLKPVSPIVQPDAYRDYWQRVLGAVLETLDSNDNQKAVVIANQVFDQTLPLRVECSHLVTDKAKFFDEVAISLLISPEARQNPKQFLELLRKSDDKLFAGVQVIRVSPEYAPERTAREIGYQVPGIPEFIKRLCQLTPADLRLLRETGLRTYESRKAGTLFANLWRGRPHLRGKSIPLLVALAFAHYPVCGSAEPPMNVLIKPYSYSRLMSFVSKQRFVSCPINWVRLMEKLYL